MSSDFEKNFAQILHLSRAIFACSNRPYRNYRGKSKQKTDSWVHTHQQLPTKNTIESTHYWYGVGGLIGSIIFDKIRV